LPAPAIVGSSTQARRRIVDRHVLALDAAGQLLIDLLGAGEVDAFWVGPLVDDRRCAYPAELTETAIKFDDEETPPPDPMPDLIDEDEPGAFSIVLTVLGPSLEINLLSLDRACDRIFGRRAEPAAPAPQKDRGGRPAKHGWHQATAQILLRVQDIGLPGTQAELANETLEWFSTHFGEIPDRRAVERFIADIWPRRPRELGPPE
jgi:hypothetical protein